MGTSSTDQSSPGTPQLSARDLYEHFSAGSPPAPVAAPSLALQYDEFCVGQAPVTVLQWTTGDGTYVHKSGGYWGGGLVGLAALRGASAIGNSRRRKRAERESQGQWQQIDSGRMLLTSRRFTVQGNEQVDMWFPYLQHLTMDGAGLQLQVHGWSPLRLQLAQPDYWFVMFNKLAYDRLIFPSSIA